MIISISGKPGSGKSSIAKIISEKLKMKRYYIGAIRREMARKKGMTIQEFNKLGEKEDSTDKEVDDFVKRLGKKEDKFIIESRTAFHFIPHSLKIFLDVSDEKGAKRIFNEKKEALEKRNEPLYKNIEEVKKKNKERMESDNKRYKKYYNIEWNNPKKFDYFLDTTDLTVNETVDKVLEYIKSKHI